MTDAFATELRAIFHNEGVLIFFIFLPLAYPIIYTLIYNKEYVDQIPVAVVDNSRTAASREFVRKASASPTITIYDYADDMHQAKTLMAEHKVFGVMLIPEDYAKEIGSGRSVHVTFYSDMSLLMRYRAFVSALSDLQLELAGEINEERIAGVGASSIMTGDSPLPINSESNFLGNTQEGFASFVIPGIVVMILQQSMLLGIVMLRGSSHERRLLHGGYDPQYPTGISAGATVMGRAFCYVFVYIAFTIYNLHIIPRIFGLPQHGSPVDYLLFIVPMMFAVAFLGQALAALARERESSFLVIVATSVVFLFLSGLTWPRYAMNSLWIALGSLIPSTWGIEGFVRINTNAATLAENSRPFLWLWGLAIVYFICAVVVTRILEKKQINPDSAA